MSTHLAKRATASPSQIFPSATPGVASDATLPDSSVVLCDWHGRVVWKSGTGDRAQIGELIWKNAASQSTDVLKAAVASVVTLREHCTLEIEGERKEHYRIWMWPLADPDIAVCILAKRIPSEIARLTDRERACLQRLAQGESTREIARGLKIGLTTVHTHLRRSREKLGLKTGEALIGFAARNFFVPTPPTTDELMPRKRSG